MPSIGEILVIVLILLLFFGAGKLPALGRSLGETIRGFKELFKKEDDTLDTPSNQNEPPQSTLKEHC